LARRQRNTVIKRAAMDVLFAEPTTATIAGHDVATIPGFAHFLRLCRQMEALTLREEGESDALDPAMAEAFRAAVLALSPEERTDVVRLAEYVAEMATGIRLNVATAKVQMKDKDSTSIAVVLEGRAIVIRVNGEEFQRMELDPEQDADTALDAAERAMAAHRQHYAG
jgi:hypothetical protein